MNHRERRQQAKRDAKTQTCAKHPGTRFIVQGTRLLCPQCYYELLQVKRKLRVREMLDSGVITPTEALNKAKEINKELKEAIDGNQ